MDIEAKFKTYLYSQFNSSPNIQDWIEIDADPMQDTDDVANYILGSMSIDDAEGEQLDYIAERIGIRRPPLQETRIFELGSIGEANDPDNDHGFLDDSDTVETGGFLGSLEGLVDQDDPTAEMTDVDFRYLIRQKAKTLWYQATHQNLFLYLVAFGSRCKIDGATPKEIEFDPVDYKDMNHWEKYYARTRGFKPTVHSVEFREQMRDGDPI